MKKKLLFIGVPLALVILIGGLLYRNFVTSPKYSLLKIKESVENHDISTFEKYVDINGIVVRLLTELPDILNIEKDAGFLGEEAMQLFTTVMQDSITKVAKESVRSFVERGHFDKQLTKKGIISKIIKDLPVDNLKISGLKEIRKEGKICKVPIDIFVAAYEGDFTLEFMMRDKGGYWQVAEISNLTDSIQQIADLKRTVPCKKIKETALYLARSLDSVYSRAMALMHIAEALATAGKTEKADPVFSEALETAWLIKNAEKARALAYIAEALAMAGKTDEALKTAWSIKDGYEKTSALADIAEALAKAGRTEEALKTAELIKDASYNAMALANIAEALAKAGKTDEADPVFSEALKTAGLIKNEDIKASMLRNIAEALAKAGKTDEADPVFSEALKTAGSIKYEDNKAWALAAKAGKTDEADPVFSEALKTAGSIKNEDNKACMLANIAEALAEAGRTEEALKTAGSIKNAGYNAMALRGIAEALATAGRSQGR
jgi:tetratricopeptide (TPR) repeat protein